MLDITNYGRVRFLVPFTGAELQDIIGLMARCVGLEGVRLELSIVDDAGMAEINEEAMGCGGPTNILSFPLVYDTYSPYSPALDPAFIIEGERPLKGSNQENVKPLAEMGSSADAPRKPTAPLAEHSPQTSPVLETGDDRKAENRQGAESAHPVLPFNGQRFLLGSLVLAPETVQREAFLYGQPLGEYTVFLMAHGFAHLLGYEHGPAMDVLVENMHQRVLESCP